MDIFITTLSSVAVLLGIAVIGFWITRKKILHENLIGVLSPLALEIALPCLIFVNIINDFSPKDYPDWWQLPLWWLFFTAIAAVLTFFTMFVSKKEMRREFAASLFYPNGIFFPLAILASIFGSNSMYIVYLFLFTIFYAALLFSTYPIFFENKDKKWLNWKRIFNPIMVVTIIAIAIKILDLHVFIPDFIITIFTLLGGMSVPLIMIVLGGTIYIDIKQKDQLQIKEMTKFVLIKNILFPVFFIAILLFIRPSYFVALLIFLQSVVPPVTAIPILAERSGGNRAIANQFMLASFISSLFTIPVMFLFFSMFFIL